MKTINFEENKFTVISNKFISKLTNQQVENLDDILNTIGCDNRYLVINQDEEYAPKILSIIFKAKEEKLKAFSKELRA